MKKLFFLFILIPIFTYASEVVYKHKWSFNIEYGFNKFDGDIKQRNTDIIPTSLTDFVYGANVEYTFNQNCGISLDYHYIPLKADVGNYLSVRTNVNDVNINGIINLTHILIPNTKSRISLIGSVGVGISKYTFNTTGIFPSPQKTIVGKVDYNYGMASTFPVSFAIEYNLTKKIDIGCKINYIAFNKDNLEGLYYYNEVGGRTVYKGVSNDYIGLCTVYLKFKIPHVITKCDDSTFILPIKRNTVKKKYNTYITNIIINSNNTNSNVNSNVNSYNSSVNNEYDGCITCKDSLKYTKENGIQDLFIDSIPSVYFDFDEYFLDHTALKIVKKVANFMLSHPEYYVEVRGYCDHMGDIDYNQVLSNNRVNTVKRELVEYYNIPKNHIIANGYGKIDVPAMKYRPNRRCDFFFFKIK